MDGHVGGNCRFVCVFGCCVEQQYSLAKGESDDGVPISIVEAKHAPLVSGRHGSCSCPSSGSAVWLAAVNQHGEDQG